MSKAFGDGRERFWYPLGPASPPIRSSATRLPDTEQRLSTTPGSRQGQPPRKYGTSILRDRSTTNRCRYCLSRGESVQHAYRRAALLRVGRGVGYTVAARSYTVAARGVARYRSWLHRKPCGGSGWPPVGLDMDFVGVEEAPHGGLEIGLSDVVVLGVCLFGERCGPVI